MQPKKIPTTVDPRYIHPIQPVVTNSDDLAFTVKATEQLHVFDSITFQNDVTLEGDLIIKSSTEIPDVHKNAGVVTQPTFTDNGDGTFTIGDDGIYNLYSSLTQNTAVRTYAIAGLTQAMTDGELGFVYANYNSGTPTIAYTSNRATIRNSSLMTMCIILTVQRNGSVIKGKDWDSLGNGLTEKLLNKAFDTEGRYTRSLSSGGLIIEDVGSTVFKTTAGTLWSVSGPFDVAEVISNVGTVALCYKDSGGVWQKSTITGFNNTQYQGASGLATLTANRYAVNWVWVDTVTPGHIYIVLGAGDYKLIEAQASPRPIPPPEVTSFGFFVGRIIVQKGATTPAQIDNSITAEFSQAAATIHNDLSERDAVDCHPAASITNLHAFVMSRVSLGF